MSLVLIRGYDMNYFHPRIQTIGVAAFLLSAASASAQISMEPSGWSQRPLGFSSDAQANRVVLSGGGASSSERVGPFSSATPMMPSWSGTTTGGQATAIGNMISVEIEGNNNTLVVDASQVNMGNQTAIVAHLPAGGSD